MIIDRINDIIELQGEDDEDKQIEIAKNMPGLVIIFGPDLFHQKLRKILDDFASHENSYIRKTVAAGFHVIAEKFGTPTECKEKSIDKLFTQLIGDEDHQVCGNILKNIIPLLNVFCPRETQSDEEEKTEMLEIKKTKSVGLKNNKSSRKNSSSNLAILTKEKILKKIIKAEEKIRNTNWRPHNEFFSKFDKLMQFYPDSTIEKKLYPIIEVNLITGNR